MRVSLNLLIVPVVRQLQQFEHPFALPCLALPGPGVLRVASAVMVFCLCWYHA